MKRIISIITMICIIMSCSMIVQAEGSENTLPEIYQGNYVIYRNGNMDNRIELAAFDADKSEYQSLMLELPLIYTWNGDLETENIPIDPRPDTALYLLHTDDCYNMQKYYLENGEWKVFADAYEDKICENATELIESNLKYIEVIKNGGGEAIDHVDRIYGDTFFSSTHNYLYGKSPDGIHNFELIQPTVYITRSNIAEGDTISLATSGEPWEEGFRNAQLKHAGHTNSPLYVYDKDYNLLKSIEFEGCMDLTTAEAGGYVKGYIGGFYYDGTFYMTNRDYSEKDEWGQPKLTFYKTTTGDDLTEITYDEIEQKYTECKEYRKVHQNTFLGYNMYVEDEEESVKMFISPEDKPEEQYNVAYENLTLQYFELYKNLNPIRSMRVGRAGDRRTCAYQYEKDGDSINILFSIDGVYFVAVPSEYDRAWILEDYIYLKTEERYYRIPISQLRDKTVVRLNDKILGFSQPPVMEDDRTLVPMRFLFEQMGAEVEWNDSTQTATATVPMSTEQQMMTFSGAQGEPSNSVTFSIDDTNATVNGEAATMDVPARLINDQTFVPLRFLSENLGYDVQWDEATNTAIITTE